MAKEAVANETVETCLRSILAPEGYSLNQPRAYGETGVDVLALKGQEHWHIEVIGHKKSGPARGKDFFESFFRAVSRLDDGAKHCAIAVPSETAVGLPARAGRHREAWGRIAAGFPELEIRVVDTVGETYYRRPWGGWLT